MHTHTLGTVRRSRLTLDEVSGVASVRSAGGGRGGIVASRALALLAQLLIARPQRRSELRNLYRRYLSHTPELRTGVGRPRVIGRQLACITGHERRTYRRQDCYTCACTCAARAHGHGSWPYVGKVLVDPGVERVSQPTGTGLCAHDLAHPRVEAVALPLLALRRILKLVLRARCESASWSLRCGWV